MNAAFLGCGGHGGSRPGAWLSGSCAPSAVPSDETRLYVLAQMNQGARETQSSVTAAGSLAPKMVLETLV